MRELYSLDQMAGAAMLATTFGNVRGPLAEFFSIRSDAAYVRELGIGYVAR